MATTIRIHLHPTTVRFRDSLRAALALGLAVLVAIVVQLDHSFWVVLGTLSVLRSSALGTGRTALLAVLGTALGVVVAGVLTLGIGANPVALWLALPIVVFLAGYAAASVPFLIGQVAFTLFIVMLFNLVQPEGLRLGLVRVQDVALGAAVSLVVAALLWPRGARRELRSALAALYRADATCLDAAFGYLLGDRTEPEVDACRQTSRNEMARAEEAFDVLLGEQGSRTPPAITWGRVTAAGHDVLLAVDAMEGFALLGYRAAEVLDCAGKIRRNVRMVVGVFAGFAGALQEGREPAGPRLDAAGDTRAAVVRCLVAWNGAPDARLGRATISLTVAWFWSVELARIAGELVEPVASVAATARSPW